MHVHRFSFELANGPLGKSMNVHHTCLNRLCVNPAHLKILSRPEHTRLHNLTRIYKRGYKRNKKPLDKVLVR
jgi:hypothetical protein